MILFQLHLISLFTLLQRVIEWVHPGVKFFSLEIKRLVLFLFFSSSQLRIHKKFQFKKQIYCIFLSMVV